MGYDIRTSLISRPDRYLCWRCRGLLDRLHCDVEARRVWCPVCKAEYTDSENPAWRGYRPAHDWLESVRCEIKFVNFERHLRSLAWIAERAASRCTPRPPTMRTILSALCEAQSFVHFATYGISHQLIGALKLASIRVPVYGWASYVDNNTRAELTEWPGETPNFHAKAIASSTWVASMPHQKLLIIDGLLAFTGSTNLTNAGLRNADAGRDISTVVTDISAVRDLNNKYFANVWSGIGEYPQPTIDIGDPFLGIG